MQPRNTSSSLCALMPRLGHCTRVVMYATFAPHSRRSAHPTPASASRQGCFGQCRAIRAAPRGSCRREPLTCFCRFGPVLMQSGPRSLSRGTQILRFAESFSLFFFFPLFGFLHARLSVPCQTRPTGCPDCHRRQLHQRQPDPLETDLRKQASCAGLRGPANDAGARAWSRVTGARRPSLARPPPRVASDRPAAGEAYGMHTNIMRKPSLPNERSREKTAFAQCQHFLLILLAFSLLVID